MNKEQRVKIFKYGINAAFLGLMLAQGADFIASKQDKCISEFLNCGRQDNIFFVQSSSYFDAPKACSDLPGIDLNNCTSSLSILNVAPGSGALTNGFTIYDRNKILNNFGTNNTQAEITTRSLAKALNKGSTTGLEQIKVWLADFGRSLGLLINAAVIISINTSFARQRKTDPKISSIGTLPSQQAAKEIKPMKQAPLPNPSMLEKLRTDRDAEQLLKNITDKTRRDLAKIEELHQRRKELRKKKK